MLKIGLLHTVKFVADTFEHRLRGFLDLDENKLKIYNLWDEYLYVNPNDIGFFSDINQERLFNDFKNMEMAGVDLIVVTCSTLSPYLKEIRNYVKTKIIAIDDAMSIKAVTEGRKILVIATAQSAIAPVVKKLYKEAKDMGKTINVKYKVVDKAFKALQIGDMNLHNKLLTKEVSRMKIENTNLIVLAQASMEACAGEIERLTEIRTLSSPTLCMEEIKNYINRRE